MSTEAVSPQTHSAGPSWGRGRACCSLAANALKINGLLVPACMHRPHSLSQTSHDWQSGQCQYQNSTPAGTHLDFQPLLWRPSGLVFFCLCCREISRDNYGIQYPPLHPVMGVRLAEGSTKTHGNHHSPSGKQKRHGNFLQDNIMTKYDCITRVP